MLTGVHGIAFDKANGRGFTSNGGLNNVTVFDLKTNAVMTQIATGENPDAILYEPFSKKIITCNGRSKDLSVIDPVANKVVATIPVGGKPETAVSDEKGKLFVNIEDKSEIVVVDLKSFTVISHWPLAPAEEPTGLAIDRKTNRLFAACGNKLLAVVDAVNGNVVTTLPIGNGCDGAAFDEGSKNIFTSNGEGYITINSVHWRASNLLPQAANSLFVFLSIARPVGSSAGANGQCEITVKDFKSTTTISLLSSIFTKSFPFSSETAVSGLPPTGMVATTLFATGSITLRSLLRPLQVMIFFEKGSYNIASGFSPVAICIITALVFRSNTVTLFNLPLLVKPLPFALSKAIP